jgi:hypothetical protein
MTPEDWAKLFVEHLEALASSMAPFSKADAVVTKLLLDKMADVPPAFLHDLLDDPEVRRRRFLFNLDRMWPCKLEGFK